MSARLCFLASAGIVAQDQAEAKANVDKRISYMRTEMYVFALPRLIELLVWMRLKPHLDYEHFAGKSAISGSPRKARN